MGRMFRNRVYGHLEYWALGKPNEELWVGCCRNRVYGHLEYWALGKPKEVLWVGCLGTGSTVTWNTGR